MTSLTPTTKSLLGLSLQGFHRVVYDEWGRADSPRTVICVHGLTRNRHDFDRLATALANEYRVICVDVVGRGDSDWLGNPALYGYPQYMVDMNALIAATGVAEVDWIGTSMGGLMGIVLAAQTNSPIKRLVLNDVGPFLPQSAMAQIAAYISHVPPLPDYAAALHYVKKIYQRTGPCTEADYEAMAQHSIRPLPSGGYGLKYDPAIAVNFAAIQGDVDLWPSYDAIRCPTLVLRGELSEVLTAETATAMTQRGAGAELVTIPDIGHYPALMDAEQIARVRTFLSA